MAIWYTDIATTQQQGNNFPGQPGSQQITNTPSNYGQNNALFEGPPQIWAIYTWTGNEAVNDIINIAKLEAGYVVSPDGHVCSGTTAPATTLTLAIGDNDLNLPSALPIVNGQALTNIIGSPIPLQAPVWVANTPYVAGNVVLDTASTPANQAFTCIVAVSGSTAPHSDSTHWINNQTRYSTSIDVHAASGNVAFATGIQFYGGPMSVVPASITPGQVQVGATANQIAAQGYQIQQDCWLQAVVLTANTIVANTVTLFRVPVIATN